VDQELSELKRRWTTSGQDEDRARYVQAASRAEGRSPDWVGYRLEVEAYSPEPLRARLEELYRREAGRAKSGALTASVNRLVRECVGSWFEGLSEDWDPAWCSCHCLPKGPNEVDAGVAKVLGQVEAVREFNRALIELAEAAPQQPGALDEARALGAAVLECVIKATRCNETWYQLVTPALELVLVGRGLGDVDLDALALLIETNFSSWTQPSGTARELALDHYAASAAEAGLAGAS
jgi:hypothetical protein